jgi:hypothetical protein
MEIGLLGALLGSSFPSTVPRSNFDTATNSGECYSDSGISDVSATSYNVTVSAKDLNGAYSDSKIWGQVLRRKAVPTSTLLYNLTGGPHDENLEVRGPLVFLHKISD